MGSDTPAQLLCLSQAALLGLAGGIVYDLLRPLRLRWRRDWITHLLDGLFLTLVLLAVLCFTLRRGQGELRLYALLGAAGGTVVYFHLLAPFLRPLWDFWADTFSTFFHLLWQPIAFPLRCGKKVIYKAKKHFYFVYKYATIRAYLWKYAHGAMVFPRQGGGRHRAQKKNKSKKAQPSDAGGGSAADRCRRSRTGTRPSADRNRP